QQPHRRGAARARRLRAWPGPGRAARRRRRAALHRAGHGPRRSSGEGGRPLLLHAVSATHATRWRLDGQLALVTGGSAGIGRAIASELLGFGARVLIAARDGDALELAREELLDAHPDGDVRALIADVSDDEQRRELLDWVEDQGEGLHILVNNAG